MMPASGPSPTAVDGRLLPERSSPPLAVGYMADIRHSTRDVCTLLLGRAITGIAAFAG